MMFKLRWNVIVVVVAALSLGALLVPGKDEQITALLRDRQVRAAFTDLESLYANGDRRPSVLLQLYKLNEEKGDTKRMEELLLAYLDQLPDDLVIQEKLAELYYFTFNYPKYLARLERILEIEPTEKNLARLVSRHRVNGREDEELRLLQKYRREPAFSVYDAERLALIYLNTGREQDGLVALREMDERSWDQEQHWSARLAMFRRLLAANEIREAFTRSLRWASHVRQDNSYILDIMQQFTQRGLSALAIVVGERAAQDDPAVTFPLVNLLVDENRVAAAKLHLGNWLRRQKRMSDDDLVNYVRASIAAFDLPAALQLTSTRGLAHMPEDAVLDIAQELLFQEKPSLVGTLLPYITPGKLRKRPLIAAQLALTQGDTETARNLINTVDVAQLAPGGCKLWYDIAAKALGSRETNRRLAAVVDKLKKPQFRSLLVEYADTAYTLGDHEESRRIWVHLGGRFPLNGTSSGDEWGTSTN